MNKPIIIYGKQPVIIHTTEQHEILVHETDSHSKKDITKILAKILNKPTKELSVNTINKYGTVKYNDGCRFLEFQLGFIQK